MSNCLLCLSPSAGEAVYRWSGYAHLQKVNGPGSLVASLPQPARLGNQRQSHCEPLELHQHLPYQNDEYSYILFKRITGEMRNICGAIDICCCRSYPIQEERKDDGEWPLASKHCCGDTCDLGNFQNKSLSKCSTCCFGIIPAAGIRLDVITRLEKVGLCTGTGEAMTFAAMSVRWSL